MRKRKLKPEVVLSSPSVRAKQTAELVCEAAALANVVRFEPAIYEASPQRLLKIVSRIEDNLKTAMLIGHNPGFEELLTVLTGEVHRMPTAALAFVELDIEKWSEVSAGRGTLKWVVKPKELES